MASSDAKKLADTAATLALYLADIHTPWRPEQSKQVVTRRFGPSTPADVEALSLVDGAQRTLSAVCLFLLSEGGDSTTTIPAPRIDDPVFMARWLSRYSQELSPYMDDSEWLDLAALEAQLARYHGYTTREQEKEAQRARENRLRGLRGDYLGPMRDILQLSAAMGYPTSKSTIRRLALTGEISEVVIDGEPSPHYRLADVVDALKARRSPAQQQRAA